MKNITIFYLKIYPFLVVKFSIYLNRRVFVMLGSVGIESTEGCLNSFIRAKPHIQF